MFGEKNGYLIIYYEKIPKEEIKRKKQATYRRKSKAIFTDRIVEVFEEISNFPSETKDISIYVIGKRIKRLV